MMDSCCQTEVLETIHKNFEKRKLHAQRVYDSSFKRFTYRKGLKSLVLENSKPINTLNKSYEHFKEKKIKLNLQEVLFPYKKKHNEILHKSVLKNKQNITKYEIKSIFNDDFKKVASLPLLHKRNISAMKVATKPLKSMKTLYTDFKKRKRPLFESSNIKVDIVGKSLALKFQNEKLKELIFI
jgi:hypothetical protein